MNPKWTTERGMEEVPTNCILYIAEHILALRASANYQRVFHQALEGALRANSEDVAQMIKPIANGTRNLVRPHVLLACLLEPRGSLSVNLHQVKKVRYWGTGSSIISNDRNVTLFGEIETKWE